MIIGICDDDKLWCRKATKIITEYAKKTGLEAEIVCFTDEKKLLEYNGMPLNVLFMDIELKETNGIAVVEQINKKWENCKIVYLTNYLFYAVDIYDTEHIFYVLKEQFEDRLGRVFDKVLHEIENQQRTIVFSCGNGQTVFLAPDEIYYFERSFRKTLIQTVWGTYEIKERIEEIQTKLSSVDFVRCHNSYIVYLPNVKEASKDVFEMKNGAKVMISRGYSKSAKEAMNRWLMMQLA